jgi:CheY-like chemotaxis protein
MVLESTPFDLRGLVEDVLDQMAVLGDQKRIELVSRYVPRTPTHVRGDHGRTRQILLNLVSNAIKFTEAGHVLVTVERVERDGQKLFRCSVEDTGIGIAEHEQSRVFEQFVQVDASPSRLHPGTGLGLAISRELVSLMGGRMGLKSTLGKGSTFSFELPLPVASSPSADDYPRGLGGLKVLVVDDNHINRWVVREQLARWDFRLEEADSGSRALELLLAAQAAGEPFDMALLDYHMPKMDGLQLTLAIKADPRIAGTVLVMLSSVAQRAESQRLIDAGCTAYLHKPIHQSELLNVMANAWARRAGSRTSTEAAAAVPSAPLKPVAIARGQRILVVEDNMINQRVAQRMLEDLGARVDVAGDGVEAIELLESVPFDVVFMDVQMPRMDGLEASAEIRRRRGEAEKQRLPIIAMTAHAMPEDRERCLAAGMDDYISKPIKRVELARVLRRFTPKRKPESEPAPASSAAEADTPPPCDLVALRATYAGDDETIRALTRALLARALELLVRMKASEASGNGEAFARKVRVLRALGEVLQARPLSERLASLDGAGSETDQKLAAVEQALTELQAFLDGSLGGRSP